MSVGICGKILAGLWKGEHCQCLGTLPQNKCRFQKNWQTVCSRCAITLATVERHQSLQHAGAWPMPTAARSMLFSTLKRREEKVSNSDDSVTGPLAAPSSVIGPAVSSALTTVPMVALRPVSVALVAPSPELCSVAAPTTAAGP